MHALIDADIFCYSFGSSKDDEGNPLKWPFVASRLNSQIEYIKEAVGATKTSFYITGTDNFRIDLATIKPYKGQRPAEKPHHYQRVRDYLVNFYKAETIVGMEADDKLSIEQMCNANVDKHWYSQIFAFFETRVALRGEYGIISHGSEAFPSNTIRVQLEENIGVDFPS